MVQYVLNGRSNPPSFLCNLPKLIGSKQMNVLRIFIGYRRDTHDYKTLRDLNGTFQGRERILQMLQYLQRRDSIEASRSKSHMFCVHSNDAQAVNSADPDRYKVFCSLVVYIDG